MLAARVRVDVLPVDGFNAAGLPPELGIALFYADCRRVLRPGGVRTAMLSRLAGCFGGHVCMLDKVTGNNCIALPSRRPRLPFEGMRHGGTHGRARSSGCWCAGTVSRCRGAVSACSPGCWCAPFAYLALRGSMMARDQVTFGAPPNLCAA